MRFTRTLAAFLVAAAAFSAMVGAAPLAGAKLKPTITAEPDRPEKPGAVVSNRMIRMEPDTADDGGIWVVSTGEDCANTCASESRVCTAESKAAQTELNTPEAIKAAVLEATGKKCAEDLLGHSRDYHGAPFVTGLSGEIECVIFRPSSLEQSSCTGLAYPSLRPLCRCFKAAKCGKLQFAKFSEASEALQVDFSQSIASNDVAHGFLQLANPTDGVHTVSVSNGAIVTTVSGMTVARGYGDMSFEQLVKDEFLRNSAGTMTMKVENIDPGTYTLTVYHNDAHTGTCGGCFPVTVVANGETQQQFVRVTAHRTRELSAKTVWTVEVGADGLITLDMEQTGSKHNVDSSCAAPCDGKLTYNGALCGRCSGQHREIAHASINGYILQPKQFKRGSEAPIDLYPLTVSHRTELLADTDAVSPFVAADLQPGATCGEVMARNKVPSPDQVGSKVLWEEFRKVIEYRKMRIENATDWSQGIMELPKLFATFTMDRAAQEVRKDFPTDWPTELAKQFLGAGCTMDSDIVPQLSKGVFVNRHVLLSRVIGWAVSTVSPTAFSCKWTYGRARPEELAWAVENSRSCTVPADISASIKDMKLKRASEFTAYDEGSPNHPSYPAMHSAASSASLFFPVLMDLTQEQIEEARKLDYAVATSRSFAGVHYKSDNLAGLAIGQQIVADALPGMLRGMDFGEPNVAAAIAKIKTHKHDWFVWEARGCAKDSTNDGCKCPCCKGAEHRLDTDPDLGCPAFYFPSSVFNFVGR